MERAGGGRRQKTHTDDLVWFPDVGVVLNDTALCEQCDFDGIDTWLSPEHAFY